MFPGSQALRNISDGWRMLIVQRLRVAAVVVGPKPGTVLTKHLGSSPATVQVFSRSSYHYAPRVPCPKHLPHRSLSSDWKPDGIIEPSVGARNCWSCCAFLRSAMFFCPTCNALLPPEEERSYFEILDCDFSFDVDISRLQRKYKDLQRFLHPDNFVQRKTKEKQLSEKQSALVNKAYRTLLNPLTRGLYMLKLRGIDPETSADSQIDSHFLHDVMEINEKISEFQQAEEAADIRCFIKAGKHAAFYIKQRLRKAEIRYSLLYPAELKVDIQGKLYIFTSTQEAEQELRKLILITF
ncbi:HSC20 protein, partial [Polypterus senegalus]